MLSVADLLDAVGLVPIFFIVNRFILRAGVLISFRSSGEMVGSMGADFLVCVGLDLDLEESDDVFDLAFVFGSCSFSTTLSDSLAFAGKTGSAALVGAGLEDGLADGLADGLTIGLSADLVVLGLAVLDFAVLDLSASLSDSDSS